MGGQNYESQGGPSHKDIQGQLWHVPGLEEAYTALVQGASMFGQGLRQVFP